MFKPVWLLSFHWRWSKCDFRSFFWLLTVDGKCYLMHMATGFAAQCHLHFCCHAAFSIRQPHGNWSWHNMATVVVVTWQIQFSTHGNWICLHMATPYFLYLHFISCTLSFHTTFVLFSRYPNPLFDPCRHPWGDFAVTWWSLPQDWGGSIAEAVLTRSGAIKFQCACRYGIWGYH